METNTSGQYRNFSKVFTPHSTVDDIEATLHQLREAGVAEEQVTQLRESMQQSLQNVQTPDSDEPPTSADTFEASLDELRKFGIPEERISQLRDFLHQRFAKKPHGQFTFTPEERQIIRSSIKAKRRATLLDMSLDEEHISKQLRRDMQEHDIMEQITLQDDVDFSKVESALRESGFVEEEISERLQTYRQLHERMKHSRKQ